MNHKRSKSSVDAEVSFEGIIDLGSMPPPASGPHDVHFARTAVATLPHLVMEELQRAKEEKVTESQRTRALAKFEVPSEAKPESRPESHAESRPGSYAQFMDELPTRPGKDKSRPQAPDLHAALPPGSNVVQESGAHRTAESAVSASALSESAAPASATSASAAPEVVRDTLPTGQRPADPKRVKEPAFPRPASSPEIPVHFEAPAPRRNWRRILFAALAFALLAFASAAFRRYRLRRAR